AAGRSSAVVADVDQPGIGQVISARNPLREHGDYGPTAVAEGLGDSTDRVLGEVLGLDAAELARLHDAGVIG
ncbi:2-methylfumaryl-CoA isomerase, partial [Mycolicibacterium insubricum]|nr:2-methylfumaryl-CoA isomerase [Mycolicibacterium insubricum]